MKVLFALNQDLNNSLETKLLQEYKKEYGYGFEFEKAINIDEIKTKLKDFDLLILNEELEINSPMTLEEVEEIIKLSISTRVILIASDENKAEDFIEKVNSLGIYDLMFSKDISIENIIFLIENPKGELKQDMVIEKEIVKKTDNQNKIKNIIIKDIYQNDRIDKRGKSIIIGIGGVSSCSGATHTTLSIASYLKKTGKVAVIEFNNKPRLANLLREADSDNERFLTLNNIYIYYQKQINQDIEYFNDILSEVKSKNYKYIIIDFGTLKEINNKGIVEPNLGYNQMARADYQILCLNGSLWKWSDINFYRCDDFAEVEPNISSWILNVNLVTDSKYRDIKKEVENISVIRKIKKSPIFLNPFNISEDNIKYLEELLKDIIAIDVSNNNGLLKIFENKLS